MGARECGQINTETKPKIRKVGEPIAELTTMLTLGWTMMLAGKATHLSNVYRTRTLFTD